MIGMPGSGKSTLGKILASRIGYDFLDTDDLLIAHYQKPLMHIIEERGVEGFIQAEGEILQTVQVSHTVLATGGSAVYSHQAMEYLRTIGTVLYLKYDVSDIAARVGNLLTRGVVCRNCTTLQELYDQRKPLYELYADRTIELSGCPLEESIQRVLQCVQNEA